jgi:5-methylcytosine-specific restriction endonuclease McrA
MFETVAPSIEVSDLDAAGCLEQARATDLAARAAERDKLRLALQWCHLHTVAEPDLAATWGDIERGSNSECDVTLGGKGTPLVAAGIAEPFAAALQVSTASGMRLMSDALDLAYRLPQLHAQVEDLSLPAWKARKVAQATALLSAEACAFVDTQLACRARGFGQPTIDRLTALAIAAFHPDLQAEKEAAAADDRHVDIAHPTPADPQRTSLIRGTGDPLDFARLDELLSTVATALGKLGDTDPFRIRRSKALGVIADLDRFIDVMNRAENLDEQPDQTGPAPTENQPGEPTGKPKRPRRSAVPLLRKPARTRFYAHFSAEHLATAAAALGEPVVIGQVDRLGPATMAMIRAWLDTPGATITPVIGPVIDLNRTDAVDAHDPPGWMRELVILRDRHCVFPWCACDARSCDLDHIEPYDEGPEDGRAPPGQTRPDNLAPLCRPHHRRKTFDGWTYRRLPDGSYHWTDPHGHTYLVTKNGTTNLS